MEESCTTFLYVDDASKHSLEEEGQSKCVKSVEEETGSSTMLYVEERCEEEEVCTIIETSQIEVEAPCHVVVEDEVAAHHTIEKMEEAGAGGNTRLPTGPKIRC